MKKIYKYFLIGIPATLIIACSPSNPDSAGIEYMPDMYRSTSYETNSLSGMHSDSMTNRPPVAGTVAIGFMPYPYPETNEGYEAAGLNLKNPFKPTPDVIESGKVLYGKFCIHCHGETGMGDGKVGLKMPGQPPAYSGALKNLPEGKIYHSIHYGKNLMGPHAQLLTSDERWKIVRYVQTLQGIDFSKMDSIKPTQRIMPPLPEEQLDKKDDKKDQK
jgi:mono/diheme cytochrome c family protein